MRRSKNTPPPVIKGFTVLGHISINGTTKKLTDVKFRVSIEIFDERNTQNFARVKKVIPAFTTVRKPDGLGSVHL